MHCNQRPQQPSDSTGSLCRPSPRQAWPSCTSGSQRIHNTRVQAGCRRCLPALPALPPGSMRQHQAGEASAGASQFLHLPQRPPLPPAPQGPAALQQVYREVGSWPVPLPGVLLQLPVAMSTIPTRLPAFRTFPPPAPEVDAAAVVSHSGRACVGFCCSMAAALLQPHLRITC
jgi:hypothetical protein